MRGSGLSWLATVIVAFVIGFVVREVGNRCSAHWCLAQCELPHRVLSPLREYPRLALEGQVQVALWLLLPPILGPNSPPPDTQF